MKYESKLVITEKEVNDINAKMELIQISEEEHDQTETIATVPFSNGMELDIKLCSGDNNYFIDMVLFNELGFEQMCWLSDDLGSDIEFEYDEDEYLIKIILVKE